MWVILELALAHDEMLSWDGKRVGIKDRESTCLEMNLRGIN